MNEWGILALLGPDEKWRAMPPHRQILLSIGTHSVVLCLLACLVAAHASKHLPADASPLSVEFVIDSKNLDGTSYIQAQEAQNAKAIPIKSAPNDVSIVSTELVQEVVPVRSTLTDLEFVDKHPSPKGLRGGPDLVPVSVDSFEPDPNVVFQIPHSKIQPENARISKLAPKQTGAKAHAKNTKSTNSKIASALRSEQSPKTSNSEQSNKNADSALTIATVVQADISERAPAPAGINNKIASAITQATSLFLPKQSFSEIDMKACQTYMEGENFQSADPPRAKARFRSAIALMDQAIPILVSESGPESTQMAEALQNVGRCYDKLTEYDRSEAYYSNSAKMFEKVSGEKSLGRGIALVYLADALIHQKKYKPAEEALLASLPIYSQQYGERSNYVAWTYQRLSRICSNTERADEATKWNSKANEILNH
ncbi:MAG: tetratricopeptide repeat protein [Candidatus Obscuribacterales bacterium]|nr:tetratricopeptide repeat protein [Candidatus Obscuribacterales bacterium]